MAEDAITDEICDLNPFKGIRIRASDPRARKRRRPIRVFSFEEMHCFAKAAGRYEALVRTFTDTGMRLGEVLPLRARTSTARPSRFAAPPTRGRSSRAPRPTTARKARAGSSRSRRPSPGCLKRRSI
jgi:integrase